MSGDVYGVDNGQNFVKRILRNHRDLRPVLLVLAVTIWQFSVYLLAESWQQALVIVFLPHLILNIPLASAMHIAIHTPIFYSQRLDSLFGILYALANGITRTCFRIDHLTHHRFYLQPEKDPNSWQKNGEQMSRPGYALHNLLQLYPRSWRIVKNRNRIVQTRFILEIAVCLFILGVLVICKPQTALAVYGFSIVWGIFGTYYWSHHQHAGLQPDHALNTSRTYQSKLYNWLAFNVGYHAAHHHKPALHWSQLADYHAQIVEQIPPQLLIKKIPTFARNYPNLV